MFGGRWASAANAAGMTVPRIAMENGNQRRMGGPPGNEQGPLERGGRSYPHKPEPAPLAVDLDGDGVDEIVVPQNQFPGRLAVIFKGPGGYRFQTVNSGFEGTISALGAIPSDDGTTPRLVVAVVHFTNMFNTVGETQIILTSSE